MLLDRLEREIAEDHLTAPQDDNADDTIRTVEEMLPSALASEIKMVLGSEAIAVARWAARFEGRSIAHGRRCPVDRRVDFDTAPCGRTAAAE